MTHGHLLPADPPGTENRRWRCQHCGKLGTLAVLEASKCPKQRSVTDAELLHSIPWPNKGHGRFQK